MNMTMKVYGPTSVVASLDPECTASIALAASWLAPNQLSLKVDDGLTADRQGTSPTLRHGLQHYTGFDAIREHLHSFSESNLTAAQSADSAALIAHIRNDVGPIVDAYFYGIDANYSTTQAIWRRVQPFPAYHSSVSQRRSATKERTPFLSVSASSLSAAPRPTAPTSYEQGFESACEDTPSLVFRQRKSVLEKLTQAQVERRSKIADAIVKALQPLAECLGEREGFLVHASQLCPADFIAYGYLSTVMYTDMPDDFIRQTITAEHSHVTQYIQRLHVRFTLHKLSDIAVYSSTKASLSTTRLRLYTGMPSSLASIAQSLANVVLQSVTVLKVGHFASQNLRHQQSTPSRYRVEKLFSLPSSLLIAIPWLAAGLALASMYSRSLRSPLEMIIGRQPSRLAGLGAAGAALSFFTASTAR